MISKRAKDIPPFIVMDVMRAANERAAAGHDVLHLEVGQPDTPAPRAVLDELIRVGALQLEPDNRVRLVHEAFTPTADEAIKFHILGTDVNLLISTIENNIDKNGHEPYFQRKVYYDNLPDEVLADFRKMTRWQAQKLLNDLDSHLAINDRDVNPGIKGTGRNMGRRSPWGAERHRSKRSRRWTKPTILSISPS